MKKLLLFLLFCGIPAIAQNVRVDEPFPSISSTTTTPYLVANVPPNSPTLQVCSSPANAVPCSNYAITYDSAGNACPNGAQDTPQPQPSTCQPTGDAQGNLGFWVAPGKYDYTVTIGDNSFGPYTITAGGSSSPFGDGAFVVTTNLSGTTPGDCANWLTGNVLGDAGVCLTGNPVADTDINQPQVGSTKTSFNPNVLNNKVLLNTSDATLNWSQSPTLPLTISVGANTVTITCPKGITSTTITDFNVYVAGTGTPEVDTLTGTTCAGDGVSGTITFTATGTHSAGYTVGTSSSGLQEASRYSIIANTGSASPANKGGYVEVSPSATLQLYGKTNIEAYGQIINFNGATVQLNADFATYTCGLEIGNNTSTGGGSFGGVQVLGLTGLRAGVPAAAGFCLNSQNTHIDRISMLPPAASNYFEHVVISLNDQGTVIDQLQIENIGTANFVCTSSDCPSIVWGAGLLNAVQNAGIFHILDMNVSLFNKANPVDWANNNTIQIDHFIWQNIAQFGLRSGATFADNPNVILGSGYIEVIGGSNPSGLGGAGFILKGGVSQIGHGVYTGRLPLYANTGATSYYYWIVPKNASAQPGNALLAGYATLTTTGTLNVLWYDIAPGGTYDVIRWQQDSTKGGPTTGQCTGTTVAACGSVATGLSEATVCNATTHICTFTDDITVATSAYTVPTIAFYPQIDYWPGMFVLSPVTAGTTATSNAKLLLTDFSQVGATSGGLVSAAGGIATSVFAERCTGVPNWSTSSLVCLGYGSNIPGAFWLRAQQNGTNSQQGAITFAVPPGQSLASTDLITFKSADPGLTFAFPFMRPTWQAGDSAFGYSAASQIGTYVRDPTSFEFFLNSLPGSSPMWKLTSAGETISLPIISTVTTGTAPFTVASTTKVTNLNVDQTDGISLQKFTATLSPTAVGANTCAEQTFTVTGIAIGDYVFVNKPTAQAGLGVSGERASTTNQIGINFCNNTASPITPTASEVYSVGVLR